jgi:hypothetical protein
MYVERKETGKPGEFDGLTIAGKRERILDIAKELGLDRIIASERLAFAGPTIDVEARQMTTDHLVLPRQPYIVERPPRAIVTTAPASRLLRASVTPRHVTIGRTDPWTPAY